MNARNTVYETDPRLTLSVALVRRSGFIGGRLVVATGDRVMSTARLAVCSWNRWRPCGLKY
jgi:hypothetical protein